MMHLQGNLGNLEQIQKQTIIVIHPGSLYVRIGRASDSNPHTELHAIARKRYPGGLKHCDSMLPPLAHMTGEVLQEMEDCRLQVSHTLQSCLQSDGRRRYATPPQQIAAFNRRVQPEVISSSGGEWTKQEGNCVIGNEVLHINPALDYNVHFPIRRGELNVHSGVGGSLTSVLTDLQDIWSWVIQFKLDIPISDLKHYRAVLIVPDIYNRHYLRELMTLLLNKMGFGSCFLLQVSKFQDVNNKMIMLLRHLVQVCPVLVSSTVVTRKHLFLVWKMGSVIQLPGDSMFLNPSNAANA
ncbi:Actin- protein 8 [Homalodisca vitripennis]|nr:Actin- protein 8 [Homalodisca vitripennis]